MEEPLPADQDNNAVSSGWQHQGTLAIPSPHYDTLQPRAAAVATVAAVKPNRNKKQHTAVSYTYVTGKQHRIVHVGRYGDRSDRPLPKAPKLTGKKKTGSHVTSRRSQEPEFHVTMPRRQPQSFYVLDSGFVRPQQSRFSSMIDLSHQDGRVYYRAPAGTLPRKTLHEDEGKKDASAVYDCDVPVPPPSRAASLAPIDASALEAAGIGARPRE